jgi:hypothetical protein
LSDDLKSTYTVFVTRKYGNGEVEYKAYPNLKLRSYRDKSILKSKEDGVKIIIRGKEFTIDE